MSNIEQFIDLRPTDHLRPGHMTEYIEAHEYECPRCHKTGRVLTEDMEGVHSQRCPLCQGTGRLMAEIRITWLPEELV
jgi:DNA-directed RNA polymerase subunit RPC12/RpoP